MNREKGSKNVLLIAFVGRRRYEASALTMNKEGRSRNGGGGGGGGSQNTNPYFYKPGSYRDLCK